jgi:hypothetical protein
MSTIASALNLENLTSKLTNGPKVFQRPFVPITLYQLNGLQTVSLPDLRTFDSKRRLPAAHVNQIARFRMGNKSDRFWTVAHSGFQRDIVTKRRSQRCCWQTVLR